LTGSTAVFLSKCFHFQITNWSSLGTWIFNPHKVPAFNVILLSVTPPLIQTLASAFTLKANVAELFLMIKMEHCKNPWDDHCKSENIKLYIQLKGENVPICQQCWTKIADLEEW